MSISKKSNSQAGWALITGGVNAARVEAHRLHQMVEKALQLIEKSPQKEHLYQVAGDLIVGLPKYLTELENQLDETSYALSVMGRDHLKDRLSLSRRNKVDQTVEGSPAFSAPRLLTSSARRVLEKYLAKRVATQYLGDA